MGCKVQSIWHIWTVLLAPLCKAPAFFTQLCRNTDHNVWNVLILSEVFNNFLFYILHILHFLFQNSLCSCLFSPQLKRTLLSCRSPKDRSGGAQQPPSCPKGVLQKCEAPRLPRRRQSCWAVAGPWPGHPASSCSLGSPADTLQLLSSWHSQESDVPLPGRWIHLLRYRDQIALHLNGQAESSPQEDILFLFSFPLCSKEKIRVHAFIKRHQTIM